MRSVDDMTHGECVALIRALCEDHRSGQYTCTLLGSVSVTVLVEADSPAHAAALAGEKLIERGEFRVHVAPSSPSLFTVKKTESGTTANPVAAWD